MPASQHITASVTISGQQHIEIDSHDRGSGSYISVITGLVMVTMFDLSAAHTYTAAWLAPHMLDFAALLPSDGTTTWRNQRDAASVRTAPTAADGPALSVKAHGADDVKRNFDRNRERHARQNRRSPMDRRRRRGLPIHDEGIRTGRKTGRGGAAPGHTNPLTPRAAAGWPVPTRTATRLPGPHPNRGGRAGLTTAVRSPRSKSPRSARPPTTKWSPTA